jgi:hypothetical protein
MCSCYECENTNGYHRKIINLCSFSNFNFKACGELVKKEERVKICEYSKMQ